MMDALFFGIKYRLPAVSETTYARGVLEQSSYNVSEGAESVRMSGVQLNKGLRTRVGGVSLCWARILRYREVHL